MLTLDEVVEETEAEGTGDEGVTAEGEGEGDEEGGRSGATEDVEAV